MQTRAGRRASATAAAEVALLVGAFVVLPFRGDRWWLGALVGLALLAATVPLTVRRVRKVLVSERPVFEAAEALAVLLTMIVVGFAALYYAMDRLSGQFDGIETRFDAIYFTVTTLATVGFGDISATGQGARIAVTAQMLFDLVFLGLAARVLITAARSRGGGGQSPVGR
jgi:voltage-gated potassium channel